MADLRVQTHRLELIAGNLDIVRSEKNDRAAFARRLNADVPSDWPPPLNDEQSMAFTLNLHEKNPDLGGWCNWYFVLIDEISGRRVAVGNGGFKGRAASDGTVGLSYSILSAYQNRGYASEAVGGLVVWAFSHTEIARVIVETLPDLAPSIRVLEKNRFRFAGAGSNPSAVRYEISRALYDDVWSAHFHR